jgi:hypothetical protein
MDFWILGAVIVMTVVTALLVRKFRTKKAATCVVETENAPVQKVEETILAPEPAPEKTKFSKAWVYTIPGIQKMLILDRPNRRKFAKLASKGQSMLP